MSAKREAHGPHQDAAVARRALVQVVGSEVLVPGQRAVREPLESRQRAIKGAEAKGDRLGQAVGGKDAVGGAQ